MKGSFRVGLAKIIKEVKSAIQPLSRSLVNLIIAFIQCHVISSQIFTNRSPPSRSLQSDRGRSNQHAEGVTSTQRGVRQRKQTRHPQGSGEGGVVEVFLE